MLNYSQMKNSLFAAIERLQGVVREETRKGLTDTKRKLEEEAFNLVVLGQFKRGKSTFINALLGESILPTAIVPLTSIVTILRYGPQLKVEVQFLNEGRQEVQLAELPAYITERENPRNKKRVKDVTVFYPSEYLKGGVRIIDTPGAGSVYSHNTDVAYAYLPYVDAAIFVTSADPPLSNSEHQFLIDIRSFVDKLFFILNKIDQVSEADRNEALDFTTHIIEEDIGKGKVKIHPLSARWALDGKREKDAALLQRSLLPDFEWRLQDFLVHEKGKVFLQAITNNLLKLVSDETISFQLEQEAIKLPLTELTRKISQFEEEMKTISKDREQNEYLLKGHLGKIIAQLDEELSQFKKERSPILQEALEKEYLRKSEQSRGNLREELEQFVFSSIQESFNVWRQDLTGKISSCLEEAHLEFAAKTNQVIERILALTSDIFELRLKPFTSVEALSKKSDFYFLFKDDPVGLELIQLAVTSALPRFIARKMILKNMQTAVAELLDRHCGRVRYDLVNRLTRTVKDFQQDLNEKIDLTLAGIRISFQKALALHQRSKDDVAHNLGELAKRIGSVATIRNELLAYNSAIEQAFQ
ncbi:MAG TPA: dynamin family protein [Syntrophobacteraceae bacterium]|nr:dynamin family protein [Syntrophobacteraceae bacterium]